MANQLKWMKHDHDSRNDDFIRRAESRFGHFGYSGYWKLLEVLHEHGSGDNLLMATNRLARELGTKPPQLRQMLAFCQESGKVLVAESGQMVNITVKNFREKQRNKSRKNTDYAPKNTLEGEVEKKEKESTERRLSVAVRTERTEREPRHERGRWASAAELVRGFFGRLNPDAVRSVERGSGA